MEGLYRAFIYAEKYKTEIILVLFALSFLMGFCIYLLIYHLEFMSAFSYTLGLFAMDVKTPSEIVDLATSIDTIHPYWNAIFIASTLAKATVVIGVVLLFFRSFLSTWYRQWVIANGGHTIIVGLGRNGRFFINSMLPYEAHKMIVFEQDRENHYLKQYSNERISVVKENVENMLDTLNINQAKNILISTGSDENNLYLAMQFMERIESHNESIEKLIVHIEDRTLRNLYNNGKALHNENVDLRPFSFYKESARKLFKEHALEGDGLEVMNGTEPFHIVIVGHTEFAISLISEACRLSNLPNENELHIHCLGADKEAFEQRLLYAFPKLNEIDHVKMDCVEADSQSITFYELDLWHERNLTHVIFAEESVFENIRISSKVSDVTYLEHIEERPKQATKFHIATMNQIKVAQGIRKEYQNRGVFPCAESDRVCSRENLLFNGVDYVAKMIHYTYSSTHYRENKLKIRDEIIKRKWKEASVNDKRNSVAQAIHINTKLKALGLKRVKAKEGVKPYGLYRKNLKILNARLKNDREHFGLDRHKLHEMEHAYKHRNEQGVKEGYFFPKAYTTTLEKLVRMEHNRWMTVLKLMDNTFNDKAKSLSQEERKRLKIHHLLKPFSAFESNEEKIYVINDLNAIHNMARYMALTGYEMVKFDYIG